MNTKAKGLGRGLGAIFELDGKDIPAKSTTSSFAEISVADITPNPMQPRTDFDEDALGELTESIRTLGVIQPITVKKTGDDKYLIISGERRYRASKAAGLEAIPAYIREADDQTLLEMAIVENIQREDLNAIEVALSMQRLVDECNLTQDSLGERLGKKRSTVTNYMRLLKLPEEVQLALREDLVSMGHARALAGLDDRTDQLAALKKVIRKSLSVRQTEEMVSKINNPLKKEKSEDEFPDNYTTLVERLEGLFSQNISIRKNNKGGGKIVIGFESDAEIGKFIKNLDAR